MKSALTIWVMTQGIAGTENQCLGVAEALVLKYGGTIVTKRVNLRFPYRLWSPFLKWGEGPGMLTHTSDPITPPWPDVLIAGGRRAIGIARYIRKASKGRTFVCVVQHPKVSFDDFDLVAMPWHDSEAPLSPCGGGWRAEDATGEEKVFITHGAPNRITPALLDAARAKWQDTLAPLPAPRTAVLIGGNSRTHRMGTTTMDHLIEHLRALHATRGGSLMMTVSRRTPKDLREKLERAFQPCHPRVGGDPSTNNPNAAQWAPAFAGATTLVFTGQGENPYHGFLSFADYIVCTTDSTSMISDAATTGKPIEFFLLPGGSARHDRFIANCRDLGVGVPGTTYTPWADAERVAEVIDKMIKERP